MTYFGFLLRFLVVPILILGVLTWRDLRRGRALPGDLRFLSPWRILVILVGIAVIYTTPWDNYLVATRVWWYDPALVTGITLGWVPLEEYTFFVLQTLLTGLWLLFLARRIPMRSPMRARKNLRLVPAVGVGLLWLGAIIVLWSNWQPGTYLGLELVWALPPILLQLALGADILWHYRRLVGASLLTMTLYLSAMDLLAIHSGTWTINPAKTLGIFLGGVLPIEEVIFFLLTNTLLVFGLLLALANESARRLSQPLGRLLSLGGRTRNFEQPFKL